MKEQKKYYIDYTHMDVHKQLIMNLRDIGYMIRFLFEGKGSQKRILILLNETGGMTQKELTQRIGIQPGSISEVLGKLEKNGFIIRQMNQEDHRAIDIQLTDLGQKQAIEFTYQRELRHEEMFSCLSLEEQKTLLELIEKLNQDWDIRYQNKKIKGK